MQIYLTTILTACYVFPILAAFLTIPYVIHQYHKYGTVMMLRTAIIYSFVFYMLTSYFMTILPLPAIDSVKPMEQAVFLEPFNVVRNWIEATGFDIHDAGTYWNAFTSLSLWVIIFNVLLLLPFGVYLRYYYKRKWWQVLLFSFAYSLFFEVTQVTGLYGIYPYPYRFFEVDDLICNTLGGMLGFWLTPLFSFFLPSREEIDEVAYKRGHEVSVIRSLLENGIDLLVFIGIGAVIVYFLPEQTKWWSVLLIPVYLWIIFTVVTYVTQGYTLGKYLVSVRLQRVSGRRLTLWPLLVRHFLLYVVCVPMAMYGAVLLFTAMQSRDSQMKMSCYVGAALCFAGFIAFIVHIIRCAMQHRSQPFYDKICRLVAVSVVDDKWAKAHDYTLEQVDLDEETTDTIEEDTDNSEKEAIRKIEEVEE